MYIRVSLKTSPKISDFLLLELKLQLFSLTLVIIEKVWGKKRKTLSMPSGKVNIDFHCVSGLTLPYRRIYRFLVVLESSMATKQN